MGSYMQIEELTKSYGDRMLFADVTFGINEGDKIGLIAKNGTGKTTMLRIIAGRESADSGRITLTDGLSVGYLEQTPALDPDSTVLDNCLSSDENDLPQVIARNAPEWTGATIGEPAAGGRRRTKANRNYSGFRRRENSSAHICRRGS